MSCFGIGVIRSSIGHIPYDVALSILESFRDDKRMLSNCALVCAVWAAAARPHQYYWVIICSQKKLQELFKRLDDDPSIRTWIRRLILGGMLVDRDYILGRTLTRLITIHFEVERHQQTLPHFLTERPPLIGQVDYFPAIQDIGITGTLHTSKLHWSSMCSMLHCLPRLRKLAVAKVDFIVNTNSEDGHQLDENLRSRVPLQLTMRSLELSIMSDIPDEFYRGLSNASSLGALKCMWLKTNATLAGVDHACRALDILLKQFELRIILCLGFEQYPGVRLMPINGLDNVGLIIPLSLLEVRHFPYLQSIADKRKIVYKITIPVPTTTDLTHWAQVDRFIADDMPSASLAVITITLYDFVTLDMEKQTARLLLPKCLKQGRLVLCSGEEFYNIM
ncbi:hypothetical protein QCA50_014717 [Cerrena zonata]|uniref:F-box domain-containing protein n=1 Tax=Cerrena zonata TaxID=2478898 RepID=A0AAW0FN08_9APHY